MSYIASMNPQPKPRIYGVNHSPWVQGVLTAFHLKGVEYQLVSMPPSFRSYLDGGMVMPMCLWPDGTVTRDSFDIMRELDKRAPGPALTNGLNGDVQESLERLFFSYALGRTGGRKTLQFAQAWAKMPRGEGPVWASCFRAFMFLYFLVLILAGRRISRKQGHPVDSSGRLRAALKEASLNLQEQPFLHGESPGFLDCALLGQVQCMVTGLTDHTIPILQSNPGLMAWMKRMQEIIKDSKHTFLSRVDALHEHPAEGSWGDQTVFWCTLAVLVVVSPVTIVLLGDALRRRSRNPARSGQKVNRQRHPG